MGLRLRMCEELQSHSLAAYTTQDQLEDVQAASASMIGRNGGKGVSTGFPCVCISIGRFFRWEDCDPSLDL